MIDNDGGKYYARIEFIQPSESNVQGQCMTFDTSVSYSKNDSITGVARKFKESMIVKPG